MNRVVITGQGRLSMLQMIASVDTVAEDPDFRPHFCVIFDLRQADYTAELQDGDAFVAALKRRQNEFQGRFALVVPEHLHFLAKLYSVLAAVGGFDRMQCFTRIEDAIPWCAASPSLL